MTASAFVQARAKLKYTAFIELNESSVVKNYYSDGNYKKYKGLRLVAIDGSKLRLPDTPDVEKEFGKIKIWTKSEEERTYVGSQSSVLYDVLNDIVIDSKLGKARSSERDLALEHFKFIARGDLVIMDRGYCGYKLFASVLEQKSDFLVRCPMSNSFNAIETFLKEDLEDKIVTLTSSKNSKKVVEEQGLQSSIQVRFIKVTLDTGETEILVTSLLDQDLHRVEDFKELYFQRWRIETFFNLIKSRLELEAFTGKSAESVKQDFFATIYVSNLETVCTEEANSELEEKTGKNIHKQKVNKAVSFNLIKKNILNILFDPLIENSEIQSRIDKAFKSNPVLVREKRNPQRVITTQARKIRWLRHLKKSAF